MDKQAFTHTWSHHLWSGPGPGRGLCESVNDSHEHQSACAEKLGPSHASHANLPMVSM